MSLSIEDLNKQAADQIRAIAFKQHLQQLQNEIAPARALVTQAIATGKPKLVLERGSRKLVFSAGFGDAPYRVTSFDEHGPSGHRDYNVNDINGIVSEIHGALRNGFRVRAATP